jgi:hypothetical protein
MKQYYKKPFFGSAFMYFRDYYNQSEILSIYCLSLGVLFKDDFEVLLDLLGNSKSDLESNIKGISQIAEKIEKQLSDDIKSTHDLYSEIELKEIIELIFNIKGKVKDVDYRNPKDLLKIKNEKIPLQAVVTLTEMMVYKMIGFGYRFPNKTKELLTYKVDENDYDLALKSGLDIPQVQQVLTMEYHLNSAKDLIKPYVLKFRPELIKRLAL